MSNVSQAFGLTAAGDGFPELFRSPAEWENALRTRTYRHQLHRAWEEIGLSAVFSVEGKPTVFFKEVPKHNPKREAEWQRLLWNQGMAAMLVVGDPKQTRVYSALAKPSPLQPADGDARLADTFETAAFALEFRQFLLSVQTGKFYQDRRDKFRSDSAVDQYLLTNLKEARNLLTNLKKARTKLIAEDLKDPLTPDVANAFLGRCLFTSYLIERGVIGETQLERIGTSAASNLCRLLDNYIDSEAVAVLFRLFRLLDDDFNGSMFGNKYSAEQSKIHAPHVAILRRLLRGDDLGTGQQVLPGFDLYDFHFIPIELISAIYENFIVGREDGELRASESERRKRGAFYTPPRLAELVVDIATEGWDTLLDKRYLDPACGSGVFLVILFQRMAAEWSGRNPNASNIDRARDLRRILTQKLCGVDVDPTACMVACFSLYLAFLDQLKPRNIWELKETLEAKGEGKVLPPLHSHPDSGASECPVILQTNFFSKATDSIGQFHLVIGNPPWVGRNQPADAEMKAWLFDRNRNPAVEFAPKSRTRQTANSYRRSNPLSATCGRCRFT